MVCCGESVDVSDNEDCEFECEFDKCDWFFLLFIVVENVFGIIVGLLYFLVDFGDR